MLDLTAAPSRPRLWIEFALLFVGVPILMTVFAGQYQLFAVIWLLAGVAAMLLILTPGFEWRMLWRGPVLSEWPLILAFWVVTGLICLGFVFALVPDQFLAFALARPDFWLLVMVAYPILSAFPQELIYRTLFFERYQILFPGIWLAIVVNGLVFAWGHLFFDSWVTIAMTGFGGLIMAWAYLRNRSVLLAWVLHGMAGQLIFTLGLGKYFYHEFGS